MNQVHVRHGSEGPRHDPYHFEEISVSGRAGKVVLHSGLADWLKLNGETVAECDHRACRDKFTALVGVDPDRLLAAIHRHKQRGILRHLAACNAQGHWHSGFPGESLLVCEACGEVLEGRFNRSAVE